MRFFQPEAFTQEVLSVAAALAVAEEAPEGPRLEVEFKRKSANTSWGFKWNKSSREDGKLVVAGFVEDSQLDKHNLKRIAMQSLDQVVCVGDELISVNENVALEDMDSMLMNALQVSLVFSKPAADPTAEKKKAIAPEDIEDEEDERQKRVAAEREARRMAFGEAAKRCSSGLPAELLAVYGPQTVVSGRNVTLELEDCLKRFSIVEAVEEDYKPVYRCSKCCKSTSDRTFASRRLWVWPLDLPPILTFQLKRFRRYGDRFDKSTAKVLLPARLDLQSVVITGSDLQNLKPHLAKGTDLCDKYDGASLNKDDLDYELYAICEHKGETMQEGHYIAFVNSGPSLEEEDWYSISDSKMAKCARTEVLEAEAYVAFYRKVKI
eukprot:860842-Amphidinium_carterae.1